MLKRRVQLLKQPAPTDKAGLVDKLKGLDLHPKAEEPKAGLTVLNSLSSEEPGEVVLGKDQNLESSQNSANEKDKFFENQMQIKPWYQLLTSKASKAGDEDFDLSDLEEQSMGTPL